jgi:hypothetical protein
VRRGADAERYGLQGMIIIISFTAEETTELMSDTCRYSFTAATMNTR